MKAKLLLLSLVLTASTVGAEPAPTLFETLKTRDGKEYRQVTVTRATPRSLIVTHADGEAIISLGLCSPEVQAAFNYNPAKQALATARAQAEADRIAGNIRRGQEAKAARQAKEKHTEDTEKAAEAAKEAEKIYFLAEVAEVLEKGVVLKEVEYAKAGEKPVAMNPEALIYLECQYMGELGRPYYKRGEVHRLSGWPNGQFTYTNKKKAQAFIPGYVWHWSPEHRATMAEVDRQMRGR